MSRHLRRKYQICILPQTEVGYGLKIPHGGPIVINSSCVIGSNVDIFQCTTIGSSYFDAAHIGDDCYIGPSVCIVENVKLGNGVTIGAGAVVCHDAPSGSTIAGVPAKIISHKEPGRLIQNKWPIRQ